MTVVFCFNLSLSTINFCVKVILFNLVSHVGRLLGDSQFDRLVCNAMTVSGRAAVDTSVGLRDSSNAELQL